MSYLDYIMETKKTEGMQTFSEWNKSFDEARGKRDAALNETLSGVADSIRARDAEDLQKDIEKAQAKAAADVKASYIAQGRAENDKRAAALAAYDVDFFLASCNAMTEDGILVNIDGNANRVSAIAFGPRKVIFIVGMNKICKDVDSAMKRARNIAAPVNAQRFGLDTPCTKTGSCMDCKSPDTICCQFLTTRYSRHDDRIHVILINDNLGF